MSGFAPKRQYSQNFLTDPKTADKIVAALEPTPGDCVIEIGPGTGVLTQRLIKSGASITAVDVDARSIEHLKTEPWAKSPLLQVLLADILTIDVQRICPASTTKVIGNIPYAITSDILFWLFEQRRHVDRAVIMMQREVAQRLVAVPRTKEYGVLSVASWFAAEPKILFHVKPGSFFPKPSVTSSVVLFRFRDKDPVEAGMEEFMTFVRSAFSQRRKVLSNSLKSYLHTNGHNVSPTLVKAGEADSEQPKAGESKMDLLTQPLDLAKTRAEELSPMQLFDLYQQLRTVP
jgi:16S rRNA (adenine1518-N6/adenine1519-N6)-dimethyltransferase